MAHQRAAHGQHLLLAAGKGTGNLFAALFQAGKALVDIFDIGFDGGIGLGKGAHFQVFLHRHLQKDVTPLRDLRHPLLDDFVRGDSAQILAVKQDAAGFGMQQAGNGVQNGGFPGAVGADQSNDFALVYLKGDPLDGVNAAVVDMKVTDFQDLVHAHASFLRPR